VSWEPLPGGDAPQPQPKLVGDALDRIVKGLGGPGADALTGVFARWEEAVGERVAGHATPVSFERGCLVVTVDEPGWATELRYLEPQLLQRLEDVAGPGAVQRIEVRVRA
jgi:predicted nucleic acid-binding Zn ribbon protein